MQDPCTPPTVSIDASIEVFTAQINAACRVIATGRIVARQLAVQSKSCGLTEAEFRLLWQLRSANSELPDQKALAERLGLSPAQVSSVVERLRSVGLLEGHAAPNDRRRQVWRLSSGGRRLLEIFVAGFASQDDEANATSSVCKEEAA